MLFQAENLTIKFGGLTAVNDFNMSIENGELIGLIGPNGAGKTTVFNMITGVYAPSGGRIVFQDKELTVGTKKKYKPDGITRLGIARTFQNIRLFSDLTALENVMIAQHMHLRSSLLGAVCRFPKYWKEEKTMRETSYELLRSVGLESIALEAAGSLPYGQQRRLEIARALATRPQFLLLDEPAAGMNPQEGADLIAFIKQIKHDYNLTILMIEHDMKVVMGICERIFVLDHGQTIAMGTPKEIQHNKCVIEAYLGGCADAED